jgi:Putative Ig domain
MLFSQRTACGSGAVRSSARAPVFATWAISFISIVGSAFAHGAETAPVITGTPPTSIVATKSYSFQPQAKDANGEPMKFFIWNKPSWAGFNTSTGRLYGTPARSNVGTYRDIYVGATTGRQWTTLPRFNIQVVGLIDRAPVISGSPAGSATVGQGYVFQPSASDPNGDRLTFSIQNKPSWATFSAATGALTGTPTQAASYSNIIIAVSDGSEKAALAGFSIVVNAAVASTPPPTTPPTSPPPTTPPTTPPVLPPTTPPTSPAVAKNCGLQLGGAATFCDTFDAPAGIGNRAGDLNGNVWGVSRATGWVNFGQGWYDGVAPTQLVTCNGTKTVQPPNDVMICNGQLREASNDNPSGVYDDGGVTVLAMYPKQPFDFAGRTGTAAFDVSNDSHGNHAAWPEFWMSNLPVPAPFNHFDSWIAMPQHGFGVRFAAVVGPGQWGLCPNGNNLGSRRWTVDSAIVVRNYIYEDVDYQGLQFGTPSSTPLKLNILDCVISPADNSGVMNHIEVRVSQGQIDIYATDAGVAPTPATLRRIASITNANLSFTRGLVWIDDVHYNADKANLADPSSPSQRQHTFVWDNVAFDGPFTYRDFSYDALDANQTVQPASGYNLVNMGKFSTANQAASWNVLNVPANPQGSAARVLFNFHEEMNPVPTVLNVTVNGHAHPTPWPFPDSVTNTWRTFAVTIPLTDLVAGTNVVQLGADQPLATANVDIVLVEVPGGVPVLPGNSTTYPAP